MIKKLLYKKCVRDALADARSVLTLWAKMKKIKTVPKFESVQEEAKFWDTHSVEGFPDYWKEAQDVKVSKSLASVYKKVVPIRLDDQTKHAVEKFAKAKGIGTSTAARMLIRERLTEINAL